jgi:hypothetical protein
LTAKYVRPTASRIEAARCRPRAQRHAGQEITGDRIDALLHHQSTFPPASIGYLRLGGVGEFMDRDPLEEKSRLSPGLLLLSSISFFAAIFLSAMLLPVFVSPTSNWALIADWIGLFGLMCFIGQQFTIRYNFAVWADGRHPGLFPPAVIKVLLVANTLFAILVVTSSLALATFHFAIRHDIYNPFDKQFSFVEAFLFFADQAMKGLFVDVVTVFNINLQTHLHLDAWRHPFFGLFLVAFRLVMSFLTLSILMQSWRRWFVR